jgi:SAM-dependent methyltransferase
MTKKKDYHDFIFENGQLVGQFDEMYRDANEIPWHQDKTVNSWWSDVAFRMLQIQAPYTRSIEVGCGLGYFAHKVASLCKHTTGVDISETAVSKAKDKFRDITFSVLDIRQELDNKTEFDLVITKDIFWYVFPELNQVIENIKSLVANNGFYFCLQGFPKLSDPFIGKDIICDPDSLVDPFLEYFDLIYSAQCFEHLNINDGPVFMALFKKKTDLRR